MDFIDEIRAFAKNIPQIAEKIVTEEGTKNALIMPFIQIMGYNVFDPTEVNPEFIADVGTKKGEKVDYAIIKDGKPILLIECKPVSADLNNEHASQLFRYFTVTPARVGILTNGIIYRFYTDLDKPNTMDDKPFLEINLLDIKEPLIEELKKFTKKGFNVDDLDIVASELRYTKEIKQIMGNELNSPSDEFIRFFASQVYPKKITQQAKDKFSVIVKKALNQFINEKINERLKSAMADETRTPESTQPSQETEITAGEEAIVTTEQEWEGYYIIKAILHEIVDPSRITIRDAKSYCAILFVNNNRKPICRLFFNTKQKYVTVFDNNEKEGIKVPIENLNEIFKLSSNLKGAVQKYLST